MAEVKYGLSAEGFKRKRLPEIKKDIEDRLADKLGTSIQTGSNSILGQLIGVFAFEIADLWQTTEDSYNAMYPNSSEGTSLTNSASLTAIKPITAEKTIIICNCTGEDGTKIPAGSQVQDNKYTYTNDTDSVIAKENAISANISLPTVIAGTEYAVIIDGQKSNYTATADDTAKTILENIVANLNYLDLSFIVNNDKLAIAVTNSASMSISVENLSLDDVTTQIKFLCDTYGEINPLINSVNSIVTSIAGWTGVTNVSVTVGRENETETELRQRWSISVYKKASMMIEAIQANILRNVVGVKDCIVYENVSDETDEDGRPPHSIEAVVNGGNNADIVKEIFRYVASGIDTYGEIENTIKDSNDIEHTIYFNRVKLIPITLTITIYKNKEESFSNNNPFEIKSAILKQSNTTLIGQDVILQKFVSMIYNMVKGVSYVEIRATRNNAEVDINGNISIGAREKATFDASRIEVLLIDKQI